VESLAQGGGHTAATMLLVLVPGRAEMEVMGWSHIGMTLRYQHMTSELMTSIADLIGGAFWSDENGDEGPAGHPRRFEPHDCSFGRTCQAGNAANTALDCTHAVRAGFVGRAE
jgi:hypothetical protein